MLVFIAGLFEFKLFFVTLIFLVQKHRELTFIILRPFQTKKPWRMGAQSVESHHSSRTVLRHLHWLKGFCGIWVPHSEVCTLISWIDEKTKKKAWVLYLTASDGVVGNNGAKAIYASLCNTSATFKTTFFRNQVQSSSTFIALFEHMMILIMTDFSMNNALKKCLTNKQPLNWSVIETVLED